MKSLTLALVICSILAVRAQGQLVLGTNNTALGSSHVPQAAGPNFRTWATTTPATNNLAASRAATVSANLMERPGSAQTLPVPARKHYVTELAGGLNYWDSGTTNWTPSVASFEIVSNAFVARHVQHQVRLEPDLSVAGAVRLSTPDGIPIESTPVAIVLYDAASGNSLVIGAITNCQGVLMSSNRVGYANAFCGVCADVIYTLNRGSFHQDVVLTGKVDPAKYGFPTNTTRIQILTELYDVPEHKTIQRPLAIERNQTIRQRMATPDLIDQELHFGSLVFGLGHAYAAQAPSNTNGSSAVVAKELATSEGRTFLVESVLYSSIAQGLAALPDCQASTAAAPPRQTGSGTSVYAAIPYPSGQHPDRCHGQACRNRQPSRAGQNPEGADRLCGRSGQRHDGLSGGHHLSGGGAGRLL